MKLLLVSVKSDAAYGGIAAWTERFLNRCGQLNIDCSLVNTELTGKRIRTGKRHLFDELIRTGRIFRDLRKRLKKEQFDAAYLNTSCGNFGLFRDAMLGKMIRRAGIPIVTQYHCEIPYWVRSKKSRKSLGKLATVSAQNLVLCQKSANFLQENYGTQPQKIPNFVEHTILRTEPKTIQPAIRRICFVGRVSETKGARELFEVAKRFPKIRFLLIGQVSKEICMWEKPANVELTGAMPNQQVIQLLDDEDVFFFPSYTEGCSMALMEAMARGLPCVATDVGANAEMLDGCGIIVDKQDIRAMEEAIQKLADPDLRRELSCRAVEKIKENYTDQNVDKLIAVIEQL